MQIGQKIKTKTTVDCKTSGRCTTPKLLGAYFEVCSAALHHAQGASWATTSTTNPDRMATQAQSLSEKMRRLEGS